MDNNYADELKENIHLVSQVEAPLLARIEKLEADKALWMKTATKSISDLGKSEEHATEAEAQLASIDDSWQEAETKLDNIKAQLALLVEPITKSREYMQQCVDGLITFEELYDAIKPLIGFTHDEYIGIEQADDALRLLWYCDHLLGEIDHRNWKIRPIKKQTLISAASCGDKQT